MKIKPKKDNYIHNSSSNEQTDETEEADVPDQLHENRPPIRETDIQNNSLRIYDGKAN